MGSDDGVNMSKDDPGVQMVNVEFHQPHAPDVDARLLWNGDHFEFTIDDMGIEVNGDSVKFLSGIDETELELEGFMGSEDKPTCPNYYCENYDEDCEKHDEKGNPV